MRGVASLLDKSSTARVEQLWRELEIKCGLVGVKVTPFPHFSWQVTEDYDPAKLGMALKQIARDAQAFTVRTAGLGMFSGENPIVYIPIIKNEAMLRLHNLLWKQLLEFSSGPSQYYAPERWVPHITLAYGDVNKDRLFCAIQTLAFQPIDWETRIDNLVSISLEDNRVAELSRYEFGIR